MLNVQPEDIEPSLAEAENKLEDMITKRRQADWHDIINTYNAFPFAVYQLCYWGVHFCRNIGIWTHFTIKDIIKYRTKVQGVPDDVYNPKCHTRKKLKKDEEEVLLSEIACASRALVQLEIIDENDGGFTFTPLGIDILYETWPRQHYGRWK